MTEPSIPVALGPRGNIVPIEEAERFKTDYYRCKECGEILNPRKGSVRSHYFAHKGGALDDKSCPLASQAGVDEMIDELRTSDVEKDESNRRVRTYIGEAPGSRIQLFGILPSLSWNAIPPKADVNTLLSSMTIQTVGIKNPPTPKNFHPSEPEVLIELDPEAEEFAIEIDGDDALKSLTGHWSSDGITSGDLFSGDQSRAHRRRRDQQIRQGEWVYLVTTEELGSIPDVVQTYSLGLHTVLAFPAREETESILDEYGNGLMTDQYGFEADIILPSGAHPTSEAPIAGEKNQTVLVSVTPSPEIDPTFEVVSIPRRESGVVEITPTGPGNPRYFKTEFPSEGSRRISIHQRNSNRHRSVHLHAVDESETTADEEETLADSVGMKINLGEEELLLSPLGGQSDAVISEQGVIATLPARVSYVGPSGLEVEFTAKFSSGSPHGPVVNRSTSDIEQVMPEISQWALQGCTEVSFNFDGIGSVRIDFDQGENSGTDTGNQKLATGGRQ